MSRSAARVATALFAGSGGAALARRLLVGEDGRFVLMLHGVSRRRRPELPAAVQPGLDRDELARLLDWIGRRFPFLTPAELLDSARPGVLLTFDDGLANNLANALPVLEAAGAPALFFVTTRHVADPRDWLPSCREQARRGWGSEEAVPEELRRDFFDGLSEAELRALAAHPFATIGSHTVHHPFLTRLDDGPLEAELAESKRYLEGVTGHPVDLFAYPTGDYDRRVAEATRRAGYRAAFADRSREVGLARYEIPRVGLYRPDGPYLAAKLSGLHRRPLRGSVLGGGETGR